MPTTDLFIQLHQAIKQRLEDFIEAKNLIEGDKFLGINVDMGYYVHVSTGDEYDPYDQTIYYTKMLISTFYNQFDELVEGEHYINEHEHA